jgi:hypothetical protein
MIKELQIAIKGDAKKNIQLLKSGYFARAKINSFSLVTGLRTTDFLKKDTKMAELNTGDGGGKKVVK